MLCMEMILNVMYIFNEITNFFKHEPRSGEMYSIQH
jgi:hypothetical protein